MTELEFEWDPAKAVLNDMKHGVSFEEAESVFVDDNAILIADPEHSQDEGRFILIGLGTSLRLLVVVYCYRMSEGAIRLISARRANRMEMYQYDRRWKR